MTMMTITTMMIMTNWPRRSWRPWCPWRQWWPSRPWWLSWPWWPSRPVTIVFVRKLEVVHKEVRGCLTWCAHCRVDPSKWTKQLVIHSVRYVGIKLLGQLKKTPKNSRKGDRFIKDRKYLFFFTSSQGRRKKTKSVKEQVFLVKNAYFRPKYLSNFFTYPYGQGRPQNIRFFYASP